MLKDICVVVVLVVLSIALMGSHDQHTRERASLEQETKRLAAKVDAHEVEHRAADLTFHALGRHLNSLNQQLDGITSCQCAGKAGEVEDVPAGN